VLGSTGGGRDTWKRPVMGKIADEHFDAALAGAIGSEVRKGQLFVHGADVDDLAAGLGLHALLYKCLGNKKRALEIYIEDRVVVLLGDVPEIGALLDAGIVDEDVAAAGALLDLPLQAGDALRIADVAADGLRFAAGALDQLQGLSGILAVGDDDPGALLRQPHGRGLTDAGRRTRDHRDLAIELSTAGWRKPVDELYPSDEIIRLAMKKGSPFTTASDAHSHAQLGENYDRLAEKMAMFGIREVCVYEKHKRQLLKL